MFCRSPLKSFAVVSAMFGLTIMLGATTAEAAEIRPTVVIDGDVVTLGDLFDDAGDAASIVVAKAPAPGASLGISISRISLAARRNGLAWRNTTGLTHVAVSRNGIEVPDAEVSAAIANAIIEKSPSLHSASVMQVDFTGGKSGVEVGLKDLPTIKVEQIAFNQRNGVFDALIRAPANDPAAPLHRVAGRAFPVKDVPVLNRSVAPGDIVNANDVQWVKLPATRVGSNIITSAASLIGMSPRYPVRTGEPLRMSDMQPPVAIAKGSVVDMSYVTGALVLLARGRALENGAIGDTIDILNPRSNRTVQGVIEGPNRVRIDVMSAPRIQAQSAATRPDLKS
jgi:flagella basal body P-ring formation protein FlgA